MKKLLLLFLFVGTFVGFSNNLQAQLREPGSITQKQMMVCCLPIQILQRISLSLRQKILL
jgi:hypothetical protein